MSHEYGTHSSTNASSDRRRLDLTGPWQFVTDPDERGRERDWAVPDGSWPDWARTIEVPQIWQEHDEYREYTGTAWYRRAIDLEPALDGADGRRTLLRFGAVDYEATIWVNGDRVGSNRGGYLPFTVDVIDALVAGENTIAVEVTDPDDISEVPHGKQGEPWYQRVSGIWQDVALEYVPAVRVERLRATPNLADDDARIELETTAAAAADIEGPSAVDATITVERDGDAVASAMTALEDRGWTVVDRLEENVDVALVTETTDDVLAYARDGGDVLAVAGAAGSLAGGDGTATAFDYRDLPEDESWNLVASLLYTVDERLKRLLGTVPAWELDGLYPYAVADAEQADDVAVGYVEGWLANPSAAIATRDYGDGTVQTCTFRVADAYGEHPTATVLVDELLSMRLESTAR